MGKRVIEKLCLFFIISGLFMVNGYCQGKIDNPVLPGVADAGVMKFNGRYYIGGVFTRGSFYVSKDLVKWDGPVHVFSMNNEWATKFGIGDDQIHANDMHYLNGTFHMYWSVNYWSRERNVIHIAHAVSDNPLGPYDEPVKDTWLDNRIDAHLFINDDGKLYFYMVKFTDGNTIWARPMKDPYTFEGDPKYIFASQPGNWETLDNKVIEGPWVIKRHNRYYMMYNANHTSTRWGNYALGVAEAAGPLDFNSGNKYPHPVVQSNQIALEETYVDLLKYQDNGLFYYSQEPAAPDWYQPGYDASAWRKGKPGFGFPVTENATIKNVKTTWRENPCRLLKNFTYDKTRNGNLSMRINHDGATRVYLNGTIIYDKERGDYVHVDLRDKMNFLKDGNNLLAIEAQPGRRSCFIDVALFDMKNQVADDILYTPGQPNILRGPNGFEWWLIYMANKNAEPRGQYINRVHFFDKKLTVDAVTGENTPGYHPHPAKPTYQYLSDSNQSLPAQTIHPLSDNDQSLPAQTVHTLSDNNQPMPMLNQTITSIPSSHYYFEAGVKLSGETSNSGIISLIGKKTNRKATDSGIPASKGGIIAWKGDDNNWLEILIDGQTNNWEYVLLQNGKEQTAGFPLSADFRPDVFHKLSVFKNHTDFSIMIDDLPAPVKPLIQTTFSGKGLPGIRSDDAATQFDGITYTIGWDEFDDQILGWKTTGDAENLSLKGDLLDQYEITVQIDAGMKNEHRVQIDTPARGEAGVYPVYIDPANYLKTTFDFSERQLVVSGMNNGKEITQQNISLSTLRTYYTNMVFSDNMERHFIFDTPTTLNAILFDKEAINRSDTIIENIQDQFHIYYMKEGHWQPIDIFTHVDWYHPGYSRIEFPEVETTELIFVNKGAEDENFVVRDLSLQKIRINEVLKQSYNLRVVKGKEIILIFVDGKELYRLPVHFPPSRVGLFSTEPKAVFNNITLFHLPEGGKEG